ncbi:unnamed protein product [Merluccius merluccius]
MKTAFGHSQGDELSLSPGLAHCQYDVHRLPLFRPRFVVHPCRSGASPRKAARFQSVCTGVSKCFSRASVKSPSVSPFVVLR